MKHQITSACGAALLGAALFNLLPSAQAQSAAAAPSEDSAPAVQIALLLDTSNSMDGLIDQARGQLWKIVNEFINARQNGRRPELQVALYEYGKSSLARQDGYLRRIQPFTTDLDKISEELFALKTNGGEEFCGWVIQAATRELAWSAASTDFKAIFIAGNEPFTQGPVDYAQACKVAIEKGIIVNTIHCGSEAIGIDTKWQDGALRAEGKYMFIDHNRAVVHFEAPQDREIARLGAELNKTYVAYGAAGKEGALRQEAQDANAAAMAPQGSAVQRALSKSSFNYRNSDWDLVDARKDQKLNLAEMKADQLPAEMRPMSAAERDAFLDTKAKERENLQQQINQLNAERSKFVAEKAKQQSANTLDGVMISTIREQAQKKNYRFE